MPKSMYKKPMKKQNMKDRLDEAETKKKGNKKKKQGVKARLDEAEGKKKEKMVTHKMADGTEHTGKKHTKDSKVVKKKKVKK